MLPRSPLKAAGAGMKRSAMKPGSKPLQRSKPMSAGTKPLKASSSLKSSTPLKSSTAIKATSSFERKSPMKQGAAALAATPWKKGASLKRSAFGHAADDKPPKLPPLPVQSDPDSLSKPVKKLAKPMKASRESVPKAEKDHMGRVAEIGCILCQHMRLGVSPAIVHHLRTGQGKQRAPNWLTLPLCPTHHQHSGEGVHDMGRRQFFERYGISEIGLLEKVFDILRIDRSDVRFALPPDIFSEGDDDDDAGPHD